MAYLRVRRLGLLFATAALGVAAGAVAAPAPAPISAPSPPSAPAALVATPGPAPEVRELRRIVIDRERRRLWLLQGADTLLAAPVAVGSGDTLSFGSRSWRFATPKGVRVVRAKEADPVWIPPLWHFVERAREAGNPLVELEGRKAYEFPDGSQVLVRDGVVGHLLASGAFIPVEPGNQVVINGILFVPPVGSENRRVRGELGAFKLDLGDGYLIHGTPHRDSIGKAATHGCIRVGDEALEFLFRHVPVGTKVHIV